MEIGMFVRAGMAGNDGNGGKRKGGKGWTSKGGVKRKWRRGKMGGARSESERSEKAVEARVR